MLHLLNNAHGTDMTNITLLFGKARSNKLGHVHDFLWAARMRHSLVRLERHGMISRIEHFTRHFTIVMAHNLILWWIEMDGLSLLFFSDASCTSSALPWPINIGVPLFVPDAIGFYTKYNINTD